MQTQTLRFLSWMVLPLLLSSCAVEIKNERFCAVIPVIGGCVCDDLLDSNQTTLTPQQCQDFQGAIFSSGQSVIITNSGAIADFKEEIEKLCSRTKCDEQTQQALVNGLNKIEGLGK